ncbi:hypothetical protein [Desulfurobacterium sp.]|uniref:hypothetical protein n=1 Tax=Desulfurobacterium sp. TaxID=2004706 RepID=UPI00261E063E|nr:hypothetical protein [Desulfurobacterium sp.]
MIKDKKIWAKFEANFQRNIPADYLDNLKVLENLIQHARAIGAWPPEEILEGIEQDIRLAKIINTYEEFTEKDS